MGGLIHTACILQSTWGANSKKKGATLIEKSHIRPSSWINSSNVPRRIGVSSGLNYSPHLFARYSLKAWWKTRSRPINQPIFRWRCQEAWPYKADFAKNIYIVGRYAKDYNPSRHDEGGRAPVSESMTVNTICVLRHVHMSHFYVALRPPHFWLLRVSRFHDCKSKIYRVLQRQPASLWPRPTPTHTVCPCRT